MVIEMWDASRIWTALESTWKALEPLFISKSHPADQPENVTVRRIPAERIDPLFIPDLSPESTKRVQKHLVFMYEEIQKIAGAGELDKAQRWLGFMQGAAWAMGMASLETFKDANREPPVKTEFKVDDFVHCLGEAQDVFRVLKVSGGYMESTGTAYLCRLEGKDHGWEDFKKLRPLDSNLAKVCTLKYRASELRQMADAAWSRGRKARSSELHAEAAKLEQEAIDLQNQTHV